MSFWQIIVSQISVILIIKCWKKYFKFIKSSIKFVCNNLQHKF